MELSKLYRGWTLTTGRQSGLTDWRVTDPETSTTTVTTSYYLLRLYRGGVGEWVYVLSSRGSDVRDRLLWRFIRTSTHFCYVSLGRCLCLRKLLNDYTFIKRKDWKLNNLISVYLPSVCWPLLRRLFSFIESLLRFVNGSLQLSSNDSVVRK